MQKTSRIPRYYKGDLIAIAHRDRISPVVLWEVGGEARPTIQYITLDNCGAELSKSRKNKVIEEVDQIDYIYADTFENRYHGKNRIFIWDKKIMPYHPDMLMKTWKRVYMKFIERAGLQQGKLLLDKSRDKELLSNES